MHLLHHEHRCDGPTNRRRADGRTHRMRKVFSRAEEYARFATSRVCVCVRGFVGAGSAVRCGERALVCECVSRMRDEQLRVSESDRSPKVLKRNGPYRVAISTVNVEHLSKTRSDRENVQNKTCYVISYFHVVQRAFMPLWSILKYFVWICMDLNLIRYGLILDIFDMVVSCDGN